MNQTRHDTLFALRYAVRVLERQARLQRLSGAAFKFASILSGTVALASLVGNNTTAAISLGLVFAVLQALEHATQPATHEARALAARLQYARVLARQANLSDADLESEYQAVVADDDIVLPQALRKLAYNDVVLEKGLDASACYAGNRLLQALS